MNVRPGSAAIAIFAALSLVASLVTAPTANAQQNGDCEGTPHCGPYEEDPGEGCNGPNDPFCNGGGGGSSCYKCAMIEVNGETLVGCITASVGKNECSVTTSGGTITCETSGGACSSLVGTIETEG